jgi:hypothetical protein
MLRIHSENLKNISFTSQVAPQNPLKSASLNCVNQKTNELHALHISGFKCAIFPIHTLELLFILTTIKNISLPLHIQRFINDKLRDKLRHLLMRAFDAKVQENSS